MGFVSTTIGATEPTAPIAVVKHRRRSEPTVDLAQLYATEFAPLLRVATVLVGSPTVAEDLVQDAFARLQQALADTRVVRNPGGYLRTSVVNGCRSHRRHVAVVARTALPPPASADPATERGELADLLDRLPWAQRAALVLRYHLDLTDDAIATALACRPATVRSHLRRGLAALRKELP